jgi:hypothetical protein
MHIRKLYLRTALHMYEVIRLHIVGNLDPRLLCYNAMPSHKQASYHGFR